MRRSHEAAGTKGTPSAADAAALESVHNGVSAVRGSERILTADEVAAWLGVKASWVYAEARAGRIPTFRLGRYVRFREDAVANWVRGLERRP